MSRKRVNYAEREAHYLHRSHHRGKCNICTSEYVRKMRRSAQLDQVHKRARIDRAIIDYYAQGHESQA